MKMIYNLVNIFLWIVFGYLLIAYYGIFLGILLLFCVHWFANIFSTLFAIYKQDSFRGVFKLLKIIFTTNLFLPFTVYGFYCSPCYGTDGQTRDLNPVDELDLACQEHDLNMHFVRKYSENLNATRDIIADLKIEYDWIFLKKVYYSANNATGIFILFLTFGFLFRIIKNMVIKAIY